MLRGLAGLLLVVAASPAARLAEPMEPVAALREGNRLYREGRLEEAYETYRTGIGSGSPHPVLAYNLATTAHRLGRLEEAILWYRRAEAVNPGDPWLHDNLSRARDDLGLQPYPAPGFGGWLARHARPVFYLAALLAWGGLLLFILRPRRSLRLAIGLGAAGALLYGGTHLVARTAPRAAVVLEE